MTAPDWPGEFFSVAELVASNTAKARGIANTPDAEQLAALAALVVAVADPLRRLVGPLRVTSGFRCLALNRAVGSKDTSQHIRGQAMDVKPPTPMTAADLARAVRGAGILPDQCIHYHASRGGHVHLSHREGGPNRGQFLYAAEGGGYEAWDADA